MSEDCLREASSKFMFDSFLKVRKRTPTGIPGSERAAKKRPSSERKVSFSDNVDIQTYSKRAPASDITPTRHSLHSTSN